MKVATAKNVLSDLMRHHVEEDNARMRQALRTIHDLCEENKEPPYLGFNVRTVAKIARAALVSAAREQE